MVYYAWCYHEIDPLVMFMLGIADNGLMCSVYKLLSWFQFSVMRFL